MDTQYRTPPEPAIGWLGLLSDEVRNVDGDRANLARITQLLEQESTEKLFVAANLLALVLFRQRQAEAATRLCEAEIGSVLARRGASDWPLVAWLALQPQINLIRLTGYLGDPREALARLDALDRLAAGAPAGGLLLDRDVVTAAQDGGFEVRRLVRNVRTVETCKILVRRGLLAELRQETARLRRRWPDIVAAGGPSHAFEVPWWLGDQTYDGTPAQLRGAVLDRGVPASLRRLEYLRWLHTAAHLAEYKVPAAVRIAAALYACRDGVPTPPGSPVTLLRWDAALADVLLRVGRTDLASGLIDRTLRAAHTVDDPALLRGLRERTSTGQQADPEPEPPVDHEQVRDLLDRLLDLLGAAAIAVHDGKVGSS